MHEFRAVLHPEFEELFDDWNFGIPFKTGARFILNECEYEFYREGRGHEFEIFVIRYYSENDDLDNAKKHIRDSINLLSFLLWLPLGTNYSVEHFLLVSKPALKLEETRTKKEIKIAYVEHEISNSNNDKKHLLHDVTSMASVAIRLIYMSEVLFDDAYMNMYKIVERISWYYFKENKRGYKEVLIQNENLIEKFLKHFTKDAMNIVYSDSKMRELCKEIRSTLLKKVEEESFPKIMFMLEKLNISADPNIIHECLKLRNSIAHGNDVRVTETGKEFSYIFRLMREVVSKYFFGKSYAQISCVSVHKRG